MGLRNYTKFGGFPKGFRGMWTAVLVSLFSYFSIEMERTGFAHAAGVVNFVILVAALSAMNSQMYITARMLFSLSRAGFAPKRFGILSGNGVPVAALFASCAGVPLNFDLRVAVFGGDGGCVCSAAAKGGAGCLTIVRLRSANTGSLHYVAAPLRSK